MLGRKATAPTKVGGLCCQRGCDNETLRHLLGFFFWPCSRDLRVQGLFIRGRRMKDDNNTKNQRVVTFLNRDEVDFLDKLGKDALFSTGMKLSRARLIAWLVDFMKGLGINGENITSEEDLERRVLEVLRQIYQEGSVSTCHGSNPLTMKEGRKSSGAAGHVPAAPQSKGGSL